MSIKLKFLWEATAGVFTPFHGKAVVCCLVCVYVCVRLRGWVVVAGTFMCLPLPAVAWQGDTDADSS